MHRKKPSYAERNLLSQSRNKRKNNKITASPTLTAKFHYFETFNHLNTPKLSKSDYPIKKEAKWKT
jgi:hypothetical protein